MNFKCKQSQCERLFDSDNEIIEHFKVDHNMKEKSHEFPCIINNDCKKQYLLVKSVKNHAKKCIITRYVFDVSVCFILKFASCSKIFKRCILFRPPIIDAHQDILESVDTEVDTTQYNRSDVIFLSIEISNEFFDYSFR